MEAQQIIALVIVGGAVAWLVWKYAFARKKGCGCGDDCSAKISPPQGGTGPAGRRKP